MKKNGVHKTHQPRSTNEKRETVLTVPDDSEEQDREQKEKAIAEHPAQAPLGPAINGSVPVCER